MSTTEDRLVRVTSEQWAAFNVLLSGNGCELNELPRQGRYRAFNIDAGRRADGLRNQLTAREHDVLSGMAEGLSNREIGARLHLSEDTVKTHARRMFRKMRVRDRAQAVDRGHRLGLLGSR
jgi:ATP/maltotriose-dependent transcriptional regulator MalT